MDNNKLFSNRGFYAIVVAYFILGFSTLAFGSQIGAFLFDEDRYFENVGAVSLFVASAISLYVFYLSWTTRRVTNIFWGKQLVYLGLALLYFFGAGEEISWGQRIFGIKEPESLAQENVQQELNIHNLAVFENSTLLKADNIFSVFWLGFTVMIPLGSLLFDWFQRFVSRWVPIAHWGIGLLFLTNYVLAGLSKGIFNSIYALDLVPFVQAVQEIKESNYEFLFVFLSLFVLWDFTKRVSDHA